MHSMNETVQRAKCECSKCGWKWVALTENPPKRCANPDCRSPYWELFRIVYVMQNVPEPGFFKIGCTGNEKSRYPAKRNRDDIVIRIPAGRDMYSLEEAIHNLFFSKGLINSEVFKLDEEDLSLLREIAAADNPLEFVRAKLAPKR